VASHELWRAGPELVLRSKCVGQIWSQDNQVGSGLEEGEIMGSAPAHTGINRVICVSELNSGRWKVDRVATVNSGRKLRLAAWARVAHVVHDTALARTIPETEQPE
jgi:hypothetical protein